MIFGQILYCYKTQYYLLLSLFFFFGLFRAAPTAYDGSLARGCFGAVAADLHHSHSNAGSEPCLQPTPQLRETLDPQPTEQCQGLNQRPQWIQADSIPLSHHGNLYLFF